MKSTFQASLLSLILLNTSTGAEIGVAKRGLREKKDDKDKLFNFAEKPDKPVNSPVKPAIFDKLKIDSLTELKPEDLGLVHNDAIEQFAAAYGDLPLQDPLEYVNGVSTILTGYCTNFDMVCEALAYKATLEEFAANQANDFKEVELPEDFDPRLTEYLEMAYDAIMALEEDNIDEVISLLNSMIDEIKEMDDLNENEKSTAIASMSVALNSIKLWTSVYTDPNHALHKLSLSQRRRRLEDGAGGGASGFISVLRTTVVADYGGAMAGLKNYISLVPENPMLLWFYQWPMIFTAIVLFDCIPASVRAFTK